MAFRDLVTRLNSVDLPTLGLPIKATIAVWGELVMAECLYFYVFPLWYQSIAVREGSLLHLAVQVDYAMRVTPVE